MDEQQINSLLTDLKTKRKPFINPIIKQEPQQSIPDDFDTVDTKPMLLPDITKFQTVYDSDKQKFFNTNAQKPEEILFCADTYDNPKNKDNYFGLTKLEKDKPSIFKAALESATKYNPLTAGVAVKNKLNEITGKNDIELSLEAGRGFAASGVDFGSAVYRFFKQNIDIAKTYTKEQLDRIANKANVITYGKEKGDFSAKIDEKYNNFYKQIEEENKYLKDKTEKFLEYSGLAKDDNDSFVYDLAGGGASLLFALGLVALTKSPAAAAELFGAYQYQSLYEESIEKGFSPIKARSIGVLGGAAEAGLEMFGLHTLIETLKAKRSFTKIAKSFVIELTQEASQQTAEEMLAKWTGLRDSTAGQIWHNIWYAGIIGGILGGGAGAIGNIVVKATDELVENGADKQKAQKAVETVIEAALSQETADEIKQIDKDEQSPVTYTNADPRETYREFGDTVKNVLKSDQARGAEKKLLELKQSKYEERKKHYLEQGLSQDEAEKQAQAEATMYDVMARNRYESGEDLESIYNDIQIQQAKQEAANNGFDTTVPEIKQKWDDAKKIGGDSDTKYMNDNVIDGQYFLVEAETPTASHNPNANFQPTTGFPQTADGKTVNDRDYFNDKQAQAIVITTAQNYDSRAIDDMPIVSFEGVVVSGNQRTMASQLAAQNNTDGKYIEYLYNHCKKFGFSPEQVAEFKHPRVVFVPNESLDYDTQTFAAFNASEKKTQGSVEKAVSLGKRINDETIEQIANIIDKFDTLAQLHDSPKDIKEIVRILSKENIINNNELASLTDTTSAGDLKFSAIGKDFLENLLLGTALKEQTIRDLTHLQAIRAKLVKCILPLVKNKALPKEYQLQDDIEQATRILTAMKKENFKTIADFTAQQELFGSNIEYDKNIKKLAHLLTLKYGDIKSVLTSYNQQAADNGAYGNSGLFGDSVQQTKNDILDDIFSNNKEFADVFFQAAYHGTPHRFDIFSTDKIGTGEGAQVHGWGLYFAANKDVSEQYRQVLLDRKTTKLIIKEKGKEVNEDIKNAIDNFVDRGAVYAAAEGNQEAVKKAIRNSIKEIENPTHRAYDRKIMKMLQEQIAKIKNNPKMSITQLIKEAPAEHSYRFKRFVMIAKDVAKNEKRKANINDIKNAMQQDLDNYYIRVENEEKQALKILKNIDLDNFTVEANKGQLFKVDIPEEKELLDEQKRFDKQPEKVKNSLKELFLSKDFYNEFFGFTQNYTDSQYQKLLKKYFDVTVTNFNAEEKQKVLKEIKDFRQQHYYMFEDSDIDFVALIDTIEEIAKGNTTETGKYIYSILSRIHTDSDKGASLMLSKYGIKGITYDGRQDGRGYVVFDDKTVKVIEKFYQPAYHGTPYKFDSFSTKEIGSGEGAAAHGWGLYFTEDKNVADYYKFKLTPKTAELFVDPKDFTINDKEHYYTKDGKFYKNNYDDTNEKEIDKAQYSKALRKAQELNKKAIEEDNKKGQLFKVDIPEKKVLLDEQKTLKQQPQKVQQKLKKLIDNFGNYNMKKNGNGEYEVYDGNELIDTYDDEAAAKQAVKENNIASMTANIDQRSFDVLYFRNNDLFNPTGKEKIQTAYYKFQGNPEKYFNKMWNNLTGKDIYNILSYLYGTDKKTSLKLNEAGIKGITYDGRQDGRCYVIFDDKAINILETYYQNNQSPRGATTVYDRQYYVDLFSNSDKSTLMHELAHIYLADLNRLAKKVSASKKVRDLKEQIDLFLGEPENDGRYSTEQQEKFAINFESYLKNGQAPNAKLKNVFERFAKWLADIYDTIKDSLPTINNEVKSLFDKILSDSYFVPDSNIYGGKAEAIKKVIENIKQGINSEVDGITITDVERLLKVAYTRKPNKPSKNLLQLLKSKNIYDFNDLDKAGNKRVQEILKANGYIDDKVTEEQAVELAKAALDGKPVYRLADNWRTRSDTDFRRNLRILEEVIDFNDIDMVLAKIYDLQNAGYRQVEQQDVEQIEEYYKKMFDADVAKAKSYITDIINKLYKKSFIDEQAKDEMIADLKTSSQIDNIEQLQERVLDVIEDLRNEVKLVKEELKNPRRPRILKDKTIPPGKNATKEEKDDYKRYMKTKIERLLRTTLPQKRGDKRYSKFDEDTEKFFEEIRRINKLNMEQAQEELLIESEKVMNNFYNYKSGKPFTKLSKTGRLKNLFLSYKSCVLVTNKFVRRTRNTPEMLKELYDGLVEICVLGKAVKELTTEYNKESASKQIKDLVENIKKHRSPKTTAWFKNAYGLIIANWYSLINSVCGKEQAEKDSIELLEAKVKVKYSDITGDLVAKSMKILHTDQAGYHQKINDYLNTKYVFLKGWVDNKIFDKQEQQHTKEELNKMQIMNYYIWSKNPLLKQRILNTYGGDQFNEMMAKLNKQDTDWADVIQEVTASLYDELNKVYIEKYGLDMPQTEYYFPSRTERTDDELDLLHSQYMNSFTPSFFKKRVDSDKIIQKPSNPINIAFGHIADACKFIILQKPLEDLMYKYSSLSVKQAFEDAETGYGSAFLYDLINGMLDRFKVVNTGFVNRACEKWLGGMANNSVIARVAMKPSITFKQILSFTNYMEDVDSALWIKHFAKMMAHPTKLLEIKDFMFKHSPYIKARYESGAINEALEKALEGKSKASVAIGTFKGFLSLPTRIGDIIAIIYGGYPMIQAQLEKGIDLKTAIENFEKATVRSQQANFNSTLGNMQDIMKKNPVLRAMGAFSNTGQQYTRKLVDIMFMLAHGDEKFFWDKDKKQVGKGIKTILNYCVWQGFIYLEFGSLGFLNGFINGDWDDVKDDFWLSILQCSNLAAFPVIGQIIQGWLNRFVTDKTLPSKKIPFIEDIEKLTDEIYTLFTDPLDMELKDFIEISDKISILAAGIPIKTLWTETSGIKDIVEGETGKGLVKLYGATENRAEKIFD